MPRLILKLGATSRHPLQILTHRVGRSTDPTSMKEPVTADYSSSQPPIQLLERLKDYGQEDVFAFWDELSPEERLLLVQDIQSIDLPRIDRILRCSFRSQGFFYHPLTLPQWCCLCKNNDEDQDHLLLHCSFSRNIWMKVMQELKFLWITPRRAIDMFTIDPGFGKGAIVDTFWFMIVHYTFWTIWLERNNRIFNDSSNSEDKLWEMLKLRVAQSTRNLKELGHMAISDVVRDWSFVTI